MRAVAQIPPADGISPTICKLLLRALRYPNADVAYATGLAIAGRCSNGGIGNDAERSQLRDGLLRTLSDFPSGLTAAAALIPLALRMARGSTRHHHHERGALTRPRECPNCGLERTHSVYYNLCFLPRQQHQHAPPQPLSDGERGWLLEHIRSFTDPDDNFGLLVASLSRVAQSQDSIRDDLIEGLPGGSRYHDEWRNVELSWLVALDAFADDSRVVDLLCGDLRSEGFSHLVMYAGHNRGLLGSQYPPESPQNAHVAAAIEDRIDSDATILNFCLHGLAAVDRGPNIKRALLAELSDSPFPHWAASALAEYFSEDSDARAALRSALMGDPVRASMIANVATKVLDPREAVRHLLAILLGAQGICCVWLRAP